VGQKRESDNGIGRGWLDLFNFIPCRPLLLLGGVCGLLFESSCLASEDINGGHARRSEKQKQK
jgi:hypothetical protein